MRTQSCRLGALLAAAVWACGGGDTTEPTPPIVCSTTTDPLQVGEVAVLSSADVGECAFLGDDAGAEYLVVPFTANFEQSLNVVVTVEGAQVSFDRGAAPGVALTGAQAAHRRLRELEAELAALGLPPASPAGGARLFAAQPVDTFWVIQNIDSLTTNADTSDFQRVVADLRFEGTRTLLYVDRESPPPDTLTDAEIIEMGQIFDDQLYPLGVQTFGNPSDVDANGKITILLTPYVNALTDKDAPQEAGIIVGFFFFADLFSPGTSGCGTLCDFSNEQEIFYGIVPDTGVFSKRVTSDQVKAVLPPVMIHEFQHMISFHQRVFVRGGSPEVLWLNEALSHIAEELGGDLFAAQGDAARADEFYDQNFLRSTRYLEEPWNTALTVTTGGGTLEERGAGWLFLRWLGDQFGNDIYGRLVKTTDLGSVNVERRAGEDFFFLFGDWVVTLYSEDLSIAGLSDRYQIEKWNLRSILTSAGAYALQPIARSFSQVRSTGVSQTLKGSSPYHLLVNADGSGDLTLALDLGTGDGGLALLRIQ